MQRHLLAIYLSVVVGEVEPPVLLDGPLDQGFDFCGLAHVGRVKDGFATRLTDRLNHPLALGSITTADDQESAGLRHGKGRCFSDARPATSPDADFTL